MNREITSQDEHLPKIHISCCLPELCRWKYFFETQENVGFVDIPKSFFKFNTPLSKGALQRQDDALETRRQNAALLLVQTSFSTPKQMVNLLLSHYKVDVNWLKPEARQESGRRLWQLFASSRIELLHLDLTSNASEIMMQYLSPAFAARKLLKNEEFSIVLTRDTTTRNEEWWCMLIAAATTGWTLVSDALIEQTEVMNALSDANGLVSMYMVLKTAMKGDFIPPVQPIAPTTSHTKSWSTSSALEHKNEETKPNDDAMSDAEDDSTKTGTINSIAEKFVKDLYVQVKKSLTENNGYQQQRYMRVRVQMYHWLRYEDKDLKKNKKFFNINVRGLSQIFTSVLRKIVRDTSHAKELIKILLNLDRGDVAVRVIAAWKESEVKSNVPEITETIDDLSLKKSDSLATSRAGSFGGISPASSFIERFDDISKSEDFSSSFSFSFGNSSQTANASNGSLPPNFGVSPTAGLNFSKSLNLQETTFSLQIPNSSPTQTKVSQDFFRNIAKSKGNNISSLSTSISQTESDSNLAQSSSSTSQVPLALTPSNRSPSKPNYVPHKTKLTNEIESFVADLVRRIVKEQLEYCCKEGKDIATKGRNTQLSKVQSPSTPNLADISRPKPARFNAQSPLILKKHKIESGLLYLMQRLDLKTLAGKEGWELLMSVVNPSEKEENAHDWTCPDNSNCITRCALASSLMWGGVGREHVNVSTESSLQFFMPTNVIEDAASNKETRPKKTEVTKIIDSIQFCYQDKLPLDEFKFWNRGPPTLGQYLKPDTAAAAVAVADAASSSIADPANENQGVVFNVPPVSSRSPPLGGMSPGRRKPPRQQAKNTPVNTSGKSSVLFKNVPPIVSATPPTPTTNNGSNFTFTVSLSLRSQIQESHVNSNFVFPNTVENGASQSVSIQNVPIEEASSSSSVNDVQANEESTAENTEVIETPKKEVLRTAIDFGSVQTAFPTVAEAMKGTAIPPLSVLFGKFQFNSEKIRRSKNSIQSTLEGLPDHIQAEIWGYLTPAAVGFLSKASKTFNAISKDRYLRLRWLLRHKQKIIDLRISSNRFETDSFYPEGSDVGGVAATIAPIDGQGAPDRTWRNMIFSPISGFNFAFPSQILDEDICIAILRRHVDFILEIKPSASSTADYDRNSFKKSIMLHAISKRWITVINEYFDQTFKEPLEIAIVAHTAANEAKDTETIEATALALEATKSFQTDFQKILRISIATGIRSNDSEFLRQIIAQYGPIAESLNLKLWESAKFSVGLAMWAAEFDHKWVFAALNTSIEVLEEDKFISSFVGERNQEHWALAWDAILKCAAFHNNWEIFDIILQIAVAGGWDDNQNSTVSTVPVPRATYWAEMLIRLVWEYIEAKKKAGFLFVNGIDPNDENPIVTKSKESISEDKLETEIAAEVPKEGDDYETKPVEKFITAATSHDFWRRLNQLYQYGDERKLTATSFIHSIRIALRFYNLESLIPLISLCIAHNKGRTYDFESALHHFTISYFRVLEETAISDFSHLLLLGLRIFQTFPFVASPEKKEEVNLSAFSSLNDATEWLANILRDFTTSGKSVFLLSRLLNVWPGLRSAYFLPNRYQILNNSEIQDTIKEGDQLKSSGLFLYKILKKPEYFNTGMHFLQLLRGAGSWNQIVFGYVFSIFLKEGEWEKVDKLVRNLDFSDLTEEKDFEGNVFKFIESVQETIRSFDPEGKINECNRLLKVLEVSEYNEEAANFKPPNLIPQLENDDWNFSNIYEAPSFLQSITARKNCNKWSFEVFYSKLIGIRLIYICLKELRLTHLTQNNLTISEESHLESWIPSLPFYYYRPTQIVEDSSQLNFRNIGFISTLEKFSMEEIRLSDYSRQRKSQVSKISADIENLSSLFKILARIVCWKIKSEDKKTKNPDTTLIKQMKGSSIPMIKLVPMKFEFEFVKMLDVREELGADMLVFSLFSQNTDFFDALIMNGADIRFASKKYFVFTLGALCVHGPAFGFRNCYASIVLLSVLLKYSTPELIDRSTLINLMSNDTTGLVLSCLVLSGMSEYAWELLNLLQFKNSETYAIQHDIIKNFTQIVKCSSELIGDIANIIEARQRSEFKVESDKIEQILGVIERKKISLSFSESGSSSTDFDSNKPVFENRFVSTFLEKLRLHRSELLSAESKEVLLQLFEVCFFKQKKRKEVKFYIQGELETNEVKQENVELVDMSGIESG
ncbi:hypothetical protein HK096_011213 [Nowakowskiella sp. JEL0078]|nr:hypothetical protein HK096_011213 [Nowakowskiella sp. JEL0078]